MDGEVHRVRAGCEVGRECCPRWSLAWQRGSAIELIDELGREADAHAASPGRVENGRKDLAAPLSVCSFLESTSALARTHSLAGCNNLQLDSIVVSREVIGHLKGT